MKDVINGVPRELLKVAADVLNQHTGGESDCANKLRALLAEQPQASALTEAAPGCFVQPVPSHCDRITWRGNYYQLPDGLTQASAAQSAPMPAFISRDMDAAGKDAVKRAMDDGCSSVPSLCYVYAEAAFNAYDTQPAPAGEREAPDGKLLVSAEPLRRVLNALVNAPHQIRELQASREPVALFADNPINILIAEYNAARGGDE